VPKLYTRQAKFYSLSSLSMYAIIYQDQLVEALSLRMH